MQACRWPLNDHWKVHLTSPHLTCRGLRYGGLKAHSSYLHYATGFRFKTNFVSISYILLQQFPISDKQIHRYIEALFLMYIYYTLAIFYPVIRT